jgi:AAA domain/Homeodomain-like domain
MATVDLTAEAIAAAEAFPTLPADNAASLRQRRNVKKIVLTATDELRNNTEKQPLQYAAIELAAKRLRRYGDARIEALDAITETALDCGLDPDEIQVRLCNGLTAAVQDTGRTYDFEPLDLHDLVALEVPPREMVLAPIIPAKGLVMLYAFRGGCKTHTAHGIAAAVSTGGKFLKWTAPKPRKVLLVDGELPIEELQQRLRQVTSHTTVERGMFEILAADQVRDGIGNFADIKTQNDLDAHLEGVELLILDNLSSLTTVIRDNDAESWNPIQSWLLRLRRRGIAVLVVHHAGKDGAQRGTSRREDVLDTSLSLRRPSDYDPTQGARFEVHIEKGRGLHGEDAKPFEAQLEVRDGACYWTLREITDVNEARIAALLDDGLSIREIADETGIPKSTVARIKKKLEARQGVREEDD